MFTKKQMEQLQKHMETARVEDLDTPDMPELKLLSWLPADIQAVLNEYRSDVSPQKHQKMRLIVDMWPHFVRYMTTILPAFTEPSMKNVWHELYQESSVKTVWFARQLLRIENEFDGAVSMYYKHRNEKECCQRMIQKAGELHDVMEEYYCHYYGHMLHENHHGLMEALNEFKKSTEKALAEFKEDTDGISYLFSDHTPITREFHTDKALPTFFARKISLFFRQEFGEPKHKTVAHFVNTIFKTHYDDNEIVKLTNKIKPFAEV